MMKMDYFEMQGKAVRLVATREDNGECHYNLSVEGKAYMCFDELVQLCDTIREEVSSIAYTSCVDESVSCYPEITKMEEEYKDAHRADADGADGD